MRWEDMTMAQKGALMGIYIRNGIKNLDAMKEHYNKFAEGGQPDKPPFEKRFSEMNPRSIPTSNGHATHLMAAEIVDGKNIAFPTVQPEDYNDSTSKVRLYKDNAMQRALENNDYIQFETLDDAINYSINYKRPPSLGAMLEAPIHPTYSPYDYIYDDGGSIPPVQSPYPIGYDDYVYQSRIGTLPEVQITAKGDPRKMNNEYYKAHAQARANAQQAVQDAPGWQVASLGAMAPAAMMLAPAVGTVMANPLVDAALTVHGAVTAPKNVKEGVSQIREGDVLEGVANLGTVGLDLWGAGNLLNKGRRIVNTGFPPLSSTDIQHALIALNTDDQRFVRNVAGYSGYDVAEAVRKLRERFGDRMITAEVAEKIQNLPEDVGRRWINSILEDYGLGLNWTNAQKGINPIEARRLMFNIENGTGNVNPLYQQYVEHGRLPKEITDMIDSQVLPRLLRDPERMRELEEPAKMEDFIKNYQHGLDADYYVVNDRVWKSAPGYEKHEGSYNPQLNRIAVRSITGPTSPHHEARHAVDNFVQLTEREQTTLNNAYGSIPLDEQVTTNLQLRASVLDKYGLGNAPYAEQNAALDKISDEELWNLLGVANGYAQQAVRSKGITRANLPNIRIALKTVGMSAGVAVGLGKKDNSQ